MKLAAYFVVFETLACVVCLAQAKKAEARAKILEESKYLLDELCSYRDYLCTTSETRVRTPVDE